MKIRLGLAFLAVLVALVAILKVGVSLYLALGALAITGSALVWAYTSGGGDLKRMRVVHVFLAATVLGAAAAAHKDNGVSLAAIVMLVLPEVAMRLLPVKRPVG